MNYTLQEWINLDKDHHNIIVNASHVNEQDDIVPWPIGMCYHYHGYGKRVPLGSHNNLILSSFSTDTDTRRRGGTNFNRRIIKSRLLKNNIEHVSTNPFDFYNMLPNFKFVVSPEGNGIDCHRHYEALWAGCIPIVEENNMIKQKYGNVPILYTKDYTEINEEYLIKKYNEMLDASYDFSRLFLNSYNVRERQQIILCSRYWTIRFYGQVFYNDTYEPYSDNTIIDPTMIIIKGRRIYPLSIFNPINKFNWGRFNRAQNLEHLLWTSNIIYPNSFLEVLEKIPIEQDVIKKLSIAILLNYNIVILSDH